AGVDRSAPRRDTTVRHRVTTVDPDRTRRWGRHPTPATGRDRQPQPHSNRQPRPLVATGTTLDSGLRLACAARRHHDRAADQRMDRQRGHMATPHTALTPAVDAWLTAWADWLD